MEVISMEEFVARTMDGRPNTFKVNIYNGCEFDCVCGGTHTFNESATTILREVSFMKMVLACPYGAGMVCVQIKGLLTFQLNSVFGARIIQNDRSGQIDPHRILASAVSAAVENANENCILPDATNDIILRSIYRRFLFCFILVSLPAVGIVNTESLLWNCIFWFVYVGFAVWMSTLEVNTNVWAGTWYAQAPSLILYELKMDTEILAMLALAWFGLCYCFMFRKSVAYRLRARAVQSLAENAARRQDPEG